ERRGRGHAGRPADQQGLLAGQPPGQLEGVRVGDLDHPVADRPVVVGRPEVLADALYQVGPAAAAGVDRAGRVGADHLDPAVGHLLEIAPGAADRAARADAGDEVRDPAPGLPPDLRAGAGVVAGRVVRVAVLVRLPGAGDLPDQPVRHRVVGVG